MTEARGQFSSRLGFILAAAGSAVGLGNLVAFPVMASKNGGAAFLIIYLFFIAIHEHPFQDVGDDDQDDDAHLNKDEPVGLTYISASKGHEFMRHQMLVKAEKNVTFGVFEEANQQEEGNEDVPV